MQSEKKMTEALQRTAMRSLETLCFVFSAPIINEEEHSKTGSLAVEVGFQGTRAGSMIFEVSEDIVSVLAGNMIGEGKITKEQERDAIGEIANVICGNFLPEAFGKGLVFEIAAPVVLQKIKKHPSALQVHLAVETGRVDLALCFDKPSG